MEYPEYRASDIDIALRKANQFIKSIQRKDGSWYGSWAVCFTYGTWFGIEGLITTGENTYASGEVSPSIEKACDFLISKQREDGSWGESFESCVKKEYIEQTNKRRVQRKKQFYVYSLSKTSRDNKVRSVLNYLLNLAPCTPWNVSKLQCLWPWKMQKRRVSIFKVKVKKVKNLKI